MLDAGDLGRLESGLFAITRHLHEIPMKSKKDNGTPNAIAASSSSRDHEGRFAKACPPGLPDEVPTANFGTSGVPSPWAAGHDRWENARRFGSRHFGRSEVLPDRERAIELLPRMRFTLRRRGSGAKGQKMPAESLISGEWCPTMRMWAP